MTTWSQSLGFLRMNIIFCMVTRNILSPSYVADDAVMNWIVWDSFRIVFCGVWFCCLYSNHLMAYILLEAQLVNYQSPLNYFQSRLFIGCHYELITHPITQALLPHDIYLFSWWIFVNNTCCLLICCIVRSVEHLRCCQNASAAGVCCSMLRQLLALLRRHTCCVI